MSKKTHGRTAFTLIELLVVVAIIALLISILFPSLVRAREESRRVACGANLSQMGKAQGTYNVMYNDWIPGSPLTTGYYFVADKQGIWGPPKKAPPGALRYNRFATNWYDWPTTLQMMMYGAASLPAPASSAVVDVHTTRAKIFKKAVTGVFHCPSNTQFSEPFSSVGLPTQYYPTLEAVSYLTMDTLLKAGPALHARMLNDSNTYPGVTIAGHVASSAEWGIRVPDGYMPRMGKLGQAGTKVFLADGTRYVDENYLESGGGITYDIDYKGAKLPFSAGPPCKAEVSKTVYGREYTYGKEYSYRHGARDRINSLFFDGHVEALTVMGHRVPARNEDYPNGVIGARFHGQAVNPKYYYPSGSAIQKPEEIFHPHRGQMHAIGTKLQ
jgi:prepilin-type N-terminal cleavage/methylation domain-containing protein/prepilin-type processing-associated H-X9-DG protein